ncbi:Ferredoxin-NAD(P)(+) reductase CarAd [Hartmannibacter diazotrophicus]|uniref:Ferredoxin-NAD(P)(+) reductase CarAd n=1 Tax=Hartmannibacter diazotrophicus TaxID=1482074 RepID=A0A2C9DCD0_9HYPH|nr:2Fe-2S iron-sulfur cluster-binding protein [Hartmannibacter diazotrophicus]SON57788.1 Ferredoxin-NAD(P)(+) reductase CarAd [Hartmannibacter diazotrophicus]
MARIAVAGTELGWTCEPDDTVLRSALRSGMGFPYECNVGSCGNCRFELIEGEVIHRRADPPGLSERDLARGRRLGCQALPQGDCVVKLRMMPRYESRIRPMRQGAELIAVRDITHDIREFRFRLDTPRPFLAGQYALLELPGASGERAYSMSNTDGQSGEWHFQIKRVPDGEVTGLLFAAAEPGFRITLDGPYGMAYLREDAPRDIVCLAGGSGLSPMISITRAAASAPELAGRRIDFIYGGRTARDICGREMLEALPGFGERIHYHPVVSAAADAANDWSGLRGFAHEAAEQLVGERLADCEIYFAGPPAMGAAVQQMLVARNVPAGQIHFDQFY